MEKDLKSSLKKGLLTAGCTSLVIASIVLPILAKEDKEMKERQEKSSKEFMEYYETHKVERYFIAPIAITNTNGKTIYTAPSGWMLAYDENGRPYCYQDRVEYCPEGTGIEWVTYNPETKEITPVDTDSEAVTLSRKIR